jgi:hypothetical protein
MPDNDDLSDMLQPDDNRPSRPPRDDRSPGDDADDSATPLQCDSSSATQDFLREQRGKLLKLIESSPQDIERIRDIYRTHLAGQFHVVRVGEWGRFWSLIDGLHALDDSFHQGSILFGGWKLKRELLQPPSCLTDNVSAFSDLPELHDRLGRLDVYFEAIRLHRLHENTNSFRQHDRDRIKGQFDKWATQHHHVFRPPVIINDRMELASFPPMTMDDIGEFVRSGRFIDLQDKVEGWIFKHSHLKAIHFLPSRNGTQGWKDFHWFCRSFNLLDKPRKDRLCFYFLIQLPT